MWRGPSRLRMAGAQRLLACSSRSIGSVGGRVAVREALGVPLNPFTTVGIKINPELRPADDSDDEWEWFVDQI